MPAGKVGLEPQHCERPTRMVRAARKQQRRDDILARARELFAEKGYHQTKIDDIVARANIARGTFYLYFEDKRSIFEELVDNFFVRISTSISRIDVHDAHRSPVSQLRDNVRRLVDLALDNRAMTRILFTVAVGLDAALDRKIDSFYSAIRRLLDESLQEGQSVGLVRQGSSRIMTTLSLGAFKELLSHAVDGQVEANAEMLTNETMHFIASGLLSPNAIVDSAFHEAASPRVRKTRGRQKR